MISRVTRTPKMNQIMKARRTIPIKIIMGLLLSLWGSSVNATHDMAVKDELERLLKEYGKLKQPWVFRP